MPAVGDGPFPEDGWLEPLHKALFPARAEWRKSRPASGCPKFGPASVVSRPMEYDREEEFSVRPGLIQPQAGEHEVVWWDPSKLKLGEEANQTLWQDAVLAGNLKPDGGASVAAYQGWLARRQELRTAAAKPAVEVFLASQARDEPPSAVEVEFVSAIAAARPVGGRRFGTLVHAVLRDARLDADREMIRALAELNARVLGAPREETAAAAAAVDAALSHPLLARARAAVRLHREYPLSLRLEDGKFLEGVIDLAFLESHQWTVVDFKTDADSPERRLSYQRQLQWYAYALSKLTGAPARAILLGV